MRRFNRVIIQEPPNTSDCSCLYSPEPIGVGTPFAESLSSYLTRLAEEHCVTSKKLIMGKIAPLILGVQYQPEMLSKNVSSIFGNSDAKPTINGMREKTRSLTLALEQLTLRQDLKYLSCLTYQGVIKERGLFRQQKAWCPKCFEKWNQESKALYEPLIWSFKDVDYCFEHDHILVNSCPHCGKKQKAIGNNSRIGYCESCKKPLFTHSGSEQIEIDDKERQIIEGIGSLIQVIHSLDRPPTLSELIKKLQLIQFYFERSLRQDLIQLIRLGKILEQLKIVVIQHKDKPLNLVNLLIPVCSLANISIHQFIKEDIFTLSKILNIKFII